MSGIPYLNIDILKTSHKEAVEWERNSRSHKLYQHFHMEWINYFSNILERFFMQSVQRIESTPYLSYMKIEGWNIFEFEKVYKFIESKPNCSEEWFKEHYPEKYADIFTVVDTENPETTSHKDTFRLSSISGFYRNPNTSKERKLELITRYPSIERFFPESINHHIRTSPGDMSIFPNIEHFLDFFIHSYQTEGISAILKIKRMKKYQPFLAKIKKMNPYAIHRQDVDLTEKIEKYNRIYIEVFYEQDPLDAIMNCIFSKYITIEMIDEYFNDIMKFYLDSRGNIFLNPHVNMEIYERWYSQIQQIQLVFPFDKIHVPSPIHYTFDFLTKMNMKDILIESLELNIERAHWICRQIQIHFVKENIHTQPLQQKILEFL
jgi:hypothetical protein